jgi:hypothetical protein
MGITLKKKHKNPEGGLNEAGRRAYNSATGSNLKPPVSREAAQKSVKKAARRRSFCARMKGLKASMASEKTKRDPDSRVNKALRKWDC